ncbi:MAG: DUF4272 domain-containing protein [Actinomycetota bacterium]
MCRILVVVEISSTRPTVDEVSDRALVLYAFVRRGSIEFVVNETGGDPGRIRQAESARRETDEWLEREGVWPAVTDAERRLIEAPSGSWPREAVADAMWRKESFGTLLWALEHLDEMPAYGLEFEQRVLDEAVMRYGSVAAFRAEGRLRPEDQIEAAWLEADAWYGATDDRAGDDAQVASAAAERFRALSWIRDRDAVPA